MLIFCTFLWMIVLEKPWTFDYNCPWCCYVLWHACGFMNKNTETRLLMLFSFKDFLLWVKSTLCCLLIAALAGAAFSEKDMSSFICEALNAGSLQTILSLWITKLCLIRKTFLPLRLSSSEFRIVIKDGREWIIPVAADMYSEVISTFSVQYLDLRREGDGFVLGKQSLIHIYTVGRGKRMVPRVMKSTNQIRLKCII